ncbi:DUF7453 family protein [Bythopirellula goksoeyrii]|uniref:PEP-CTERM protein-sorting domain-containing protein n=1 Tax=Bythopirellula goksoeyrii TaxID=1400387 RepID=A0A5B9QJA7_9BACT|nr:choice-of-anchor tandem repeat NxxGxxAF-containing protein [Bythopirellula goksoeyrii]QEG37116.1 hypothetical protein Pr1d_44560 [Bythopirellula goksoeyrii]
MNRSSWNLVHLLTSSAMLIGLVISPALAGVKVIVVTGDPAPDGNGVFSVGRAGGFSSVVLNNAEQVAFTALLAGTSGGGADDTGIYYGNGTTLTKIVREGQTVPGGSNTLSSFANPLFSAFSFNDAGQVAFNSSVAVHTPDPGTHRAVFMGDGTALTQIVRTGQTTPDGNNVYQNLGDPALNDSGQVAFLSDLDGLGSGIYGHMGSMLSQVVRDGEMVPDGNGTFSRIAGNASPSDTTLNNAGQSAFVGLLTGTSGGDSDDSGIFRSDSQSLTEIARKGQNAPDGNGTFLLFSSSIAPPAINDAGQVAFLSFLDSTSGGTIDDRGIFLGDGSTIVQMVREGESAPNGNGIFSDFQFPSLNNMGQVAFHSDLNDTTGGLSDDSGIFRSDGASLVQIAREGQPVPKGTGNFLSFTDPAINEAGQMVFYASYSSFGRGIFFYDDSLGLIPLAQVDDEFLGSTIRQVGFAQKGFNNHGQVAYTFNLADGRSGIALWSIPEPSSVVLLLLGGTLLLHCRRP